MIDLTGSTEACFALMSRIGIGVEDWPYYRVESDSKGGYAQMGRTHFPLTNLG